MSRVGSGDREVIRILHVDDEPDLAELAATFVERSLTGATIETETDPRAALETLRGEPFDCVVSDYDMPGMDGLAFLESVRERYPDLPFILFTGKGSEEIASQAIESGVTGYLQKEQGTDQYKVLANRIENAVERSRSNRQLADSQRRLSLLFDQSPLAVIEWNLDFEVARWNRAAEEIFGWARTEAVGRHASFIAPDDEWSTIESVFENLLADAGGRHSINDNVTKPGERITCEWHNRVVFEDDEPILVFSLAQDITEREARKEELKRYETMVETVADGLYTLDDDLTFTAVNEGMVGLTGYTREQLVGSHLSLLLDDARLERARSARREAYESGTGIDRLEMMLERADGEAVPCEVRYGVLESENGFRGTAGVFRAKDGE